MTTPAATGGANMPSEARPSPGGDSTDAAPIPLSVPELGGNEAEYLQECVETEWVSSAGPFVDRFEREFAERLGVDGAVATVNGTAALHLALRVAGVGADDEVIVPALTFIAPANAVRYVGAWPVFVDVEPEHFQLDVEAVRRFLEEACRSTDEGPVHRETGRHVAAVLPVHLLGHPVEMDGLLELAEEHGLAVIEDATQSLGARHRGRPAGTLGDVACFSFNGNKLITTGGGGMLVADREEWRERARYLSTQAKDDPVEYVHREIGHNYRLSNVHAALGCAQLERVDEHVAAKRRIARRYGEAFRGVPGVRPMGEAPWADSVFWLYTILLDDDIAGGSSRPLMEHLRRRDVESRPLWQPLNRSPAHEASRRPCPVAEELARRALSLPCSVGLEADDQRRVIEAVEDFVAGRGTNGAAAARGSAAGEG